MERKSKGKSKLKWRILRNVSVIITLSMLISSFIGFIYFNRVVRDQKRADEIYNQDQVINQINFITEDIESFAKSIIVDETLQENIKINTFENEFDKVRIFDYVSKRLTFYNGLRTYIAGSFLETEDGRKYSNNLTDYKALDNKFNKTEINEYIENNDAYSSPYFSEEAWINTPVIAYKTKIWKLNGFGKPQGTLYLEIYLDYFLNIIELYSTKYDNVVLIGSNNEVLFSKDLDNKITDYLKNNKETFHLENGYLIKGNIDKNGWTLYTLISNDYLWEQSKFVFEFFLITFFISLLLILFSISKILNSIIKPITKLSYAMSKNTFNEMISIGKTNTGDEIETLYECYQNMILEIQRGIEDRIESEKLKKDMELEIMISQINPHYLYNILNTIVYLSSDSRNEDVVKVTKSLMYSLQATINLGEHNIETSIKDELELTKCYIEIQRYRYPEMFDIEIKCEDNILDFKILKTSIQPLVENAIIHGILSSDRKGKINIFINIVNENIKIAVKDNGIGIEEDIREAFIKKEKNKYIDGDRKHIGISNIRDRIEYLYGTEYKMEINNIEHGTEVVLTLPIIE
ncbi:MAG: sensor histidine kinase [Bacilli bacterium]